MLVLGLSTVAVAAPTVHSRVEDGYAVYWRQAGQANEYSELAEWLAPDIRSNADANRGLQARLMKTVRPPSDVEYRILESYQHGGHGAIVAEFSRNGKVFDPTLIELVNKDGRWLVGRSRVPGRLVPGLWREGSLSAERYGVTGTVVYKGNEYQVTGGIGFYNERMREINIVAFTRPLDVHRIRAQRFGYSAPIGEPGFLLSLNNEGTDYLPEGGPVRVVCLNSFGILPQGQVEGQCKGGADVEVAVPPDYESVGHVEGRIKTSDWMLTLDTPLFRVKEITGASPHR